MHRLSMFWKGFLGAVVGTLIVLTLGGVVWHAAADHATFHGLLNAIERNNAAAKQARPPTP